MATIVLTHEPQENELAFGPIIATTYNSDVDGYTHAIQVINYSDDETIATLRQQPNRVGYTHFDLSPILQRQITNRPDLTNIFSLGSSQLEGYEYYFKYGWIDDDGIFQFSATTAYKRVIYGRKGFTEVDWDNTSYTPNMSSAGITNVIVSKANPLTDRNYDIWDALDLEGSKPAYVAGDVWRMTRRWEDSYTLSYFNQWRGTPLSSFNGINGFDIVGYDSSNTEVLNQTILNLTSNGGGPNVAFNDEETPRADHTMISVQAGEFYGGIAAAPTTTYLYITPWSYYYDPDTATDKIYPWYSTRIDIDNGECNDFSPIQVSWINSFGGRDYFSFEKRNDYNIDVERKEYNKVLGDWNLTSYTPETYDRGAKVYATSINETYTANTRYLTDDESKYLKNLFISPDVSVRFDGDDFWTPVVLTSNSYTERTFRKDKLFQHTIDFKLANKPIIQNG